MDMAFNAMMAQQQQQMQLMQQLQAMRNQRQMGCGCGPSGFPQQSGPGFQGNISDAHVGGGRLDWRGGFFGGWGMQPNEGYALDQNRNGRYDRGRDGVLVFDTNRDGRYDKNDVQRTNNMMQAVQGNFDFNNDGRVSMSERIQGAALRRRYQQLDTNRDGVLNTQEIAQGGGRVWVDQNRNGNVQANELHSAYRMPNANGYGPSQRLDFVDPFRQVSHTSNNWGFPGSFSGGYPGGSYGGWQGGGSFGGWSGAAYNQY